MTAKTLREALFALFWIVLWATLLVTQGIGIAKP